MHDRIELERGWLPLRQIRPPVRNAARCLRELWPPYVQRSLRGSCTLTCLPKTHRGDAFIGIAVCRSSTLSCNSLITLDRSDSALLRCVSSPAFSSLIFSA